MKIIKEILWKYKLFLNRIAFKFIKSSNFRIGNKFLAHSRYIHEHFLDDTKCYIRRKKWLKNIRGIK